MMPLRAPLGVWKSSPVSTETWQVQRHPHSCHSVEIWTALIIWESKPEVISMPIHVGSSSRYSILRFLFLYHGTVSCNTRRVSIGSAPLAVNAAPRTGAILGRFSKEVTAKQQRRRRSSAFECLTAGYQRSVLGEACAWGSGQVNILP